MAFAPRLPVTPFLDNSTGMPAAAWHQYLASLGATTTTATVATATGGTTNVATSVPTATAASVVTFPALPSPAFTAISPGAVIPKFRVRCFIPATPETTALDLYYQEADSITTIDPNGWIHHGTVGSVTGTPLTPSSFVDVEILNAQPTATGRAYFFVYILSNASEKSGPSETSDAFIWPPNGQFLVDPLNPQIFAALDNNGNVTKIKVSTKFAQPMETLPDGFAVMYSMTDVPNQVTITADAGDTLTIGTADIEANGTGVALAGSTAGEIVNTDLSHPNDPSQYPIISKYWVQFGQSSWRKATGVTLTSFLFDPPFEFAPTAGETTNWAEIGWFDDRTTDTADTYGVPGESYRLGCLTSGTQYEVLSWTGVTNTSGTFYITGCNRGLEGTVPLNAAGLTMHYYPAPGAGTVIIPIPASSFTVAPDGTQTAETEVNITLPAGWSMSVTCMTYKGVLGKLIRSDIVPLTFGGIYK
jgi:hypothetical protein